MPENRSILTPGELPAARKVARHRIRNTLQKRILSGEWGPGARLRQQQLAKDFGVSMGLVREALLELQAWGLVETHDNRGVFVRKWNAERVIEAYEVREVMDGLAARRCCGRIRPAQIAELRELAERLYALAQQGKSEEAAAMDREFHHRLVEIAGSGMVSRLADNYRFVGKVLWFKSDPAITRQTHLAILGAIESGDGEQAERLAREHVVFGRKQLESQIAAGVFEPHWIT